MATGKSFIVPSSYNIWEEIVKESEATVNRYQSEYRPKYDDKVNVIPFDPAVVTPVMFGKSCEVVDEPMQADEIFSRFDSSKIHPAFAGYREKIIEQKEKVVESITPTELPNPKTCPPKEYLETYVFPTVMPAIRNLLAQAKKLRALERRRTKLDALEWLTEYLYKNNMNHKDEREDIVLDDIPFVKEVLDKHPRQPLPLSLLLSDDEAATIIQSAFRGYLVRRDSEVQELREYQREMRKIPNDKILYETLDYWSEKNNKDNANENPREQHQSSI